MDLPVPEWFKDLPELYRFWGGVSFFALLVFSIGGLLVADLDRDTRARAQQQHSTLHEPASVTTPAGVRADNASAQASHFHTPPSARSDPSRQQGSEARAKRARDIGKQIVAPS